jgi:TRAP-type C4-dicarboxylate transport system substrate-binding protein
LQTGLIDTVVTSPIAAIALQWHTRVKYLTDTPLSYFYAFLAINKKTFKKISPDDQLIVREIMSNAFKEIDAQNRKDNINAKKALENQGIKFIKISEETLTAWHQAGEKARDILKNKGIYTPEIVKTLEDNLESFRNSHSITKK